MIRVAIFLVVSIIIIWFSWPSLKKPSSHGFPRFFAFESVLALVLLNLKYWFVDPFSVRQIFSWGCLCASLFLVIHAVHLLRVVGKPGDRLEDTTRLVQVGAYRYIRHPMYSSLLFLGWGAYLKAPGWLTSILVLLATVSLILTAKLEERENLSKFGDEYVAYMEKTKMFLPYLL